MTSRPNIKFTKEREEKEMVLFAKIFSRQKPREMGKLGFVEE